MFLCAMSCFFCLFNADPTQNLLHAHFARTSHFLYGRQGKAIKSAFPLVPPTKRPLLHNHPFSQPPSYVSLVNYSPDTMLKIVLVFVCAILMAGNAQACVFLDIECVIKEFIENIGSGLIGDTQKAFEKAMDHVFDRDISPLLDKAIAAIDAGIDKVDKDVNETINHIESSIEAIIQDAAQTANALASNVTHDIEEIIRKATTAMEQVENTFYQDASNLLAQINQIVQKGQCMEAGGAKQIQDQLYKLLKSLDPNYRVSSCWRSLGHKISTTLEDLTNIQLYNYQKACMLLNKITPRTPIEGPGGILETYAQGQLYAAEYYCIGETANAPAFQDVLSKEWLWWGVQYNFWKNKGSLKNGTNTSCGTPVECYAQAIKALQDAEQKIFAIHTGLLEGNHTLLKNSQAIAANGQAITANGRAISNNTNGIKTNKNAIGTISTNEEEISKKLSTLTAYPCNCEETLDKSTYLSTCHSPTAVSQGYANYCQGSPCPHTWSPILDYRSMRGIRCCELCMGTAEEAAAYALANPPSPPVAMECSAADMTQAEPEAI